MSKRDHAYYNKRTKEIIEELVRLERENKLGCEYHLQLCKELQRNDDKDYHLVRNYRIHSRSRRKAA